MKTMRVIKAERLVNVINSDLTSLIKEIDTLRMEYEVGNIQPCRARKIANKKLFLADVATSRIINICNKYKIDSYSIADIGVKIDMQESLYDFFNF